MEKPPEPPSTRKMFSSDKERRRCEEKPLLQSNGEVLGVMSTSSSAYLMSPITTNSSGFFPLMGAAPQPRRAADTPLQLTLSGPAQRGTQDPLSLDLSFENTGKGFALVLNFLDGSLRGLRYPSYELYARDLATNQAYRYEERGERFCGNVNPFSQSDYVSIPLGEKSDTPGESAYYLQDATLPREGRYALWVVYRFCNFEGADRYGSVYNTDALVGVYASNELLIEITPQAPTPNNAINLP